MRSQDEIVAHIKANSGFMDFTCGALLEYLDFERAREFLDGDTTAEKWEQKSAGREAILDAMRDYMEFAWGKVEDHRGISAKRSVDKMRAWTWLLGDEETLKAFDAADYKNYGAPKLAVICKAYGFPIPEGSDIQRMIAGEPCGSMEGCGCGS